MAKESVLFDTQKKEAYSSLLFSYRVRPAAKDQNTRIRQDFLPPTPLLKVSAILSDSFLL
jgi:predicted component of type VI protein secretion system